VQGEVQQDRGTQRNKNPNAFLLVIKEHYNSKKYMHVKINIRQTRNHNCLIEYAQLRYWDLIKVLTSGPP